MVERGILDLGICRIPGLKCQDRIALARHLEHEEELPHLGRGDLERIIARSFQGRTWEPASYLEAGRRDAKEAKIRGIGYLSYVDEAYPPLLRELPDPPLVLFYRGALPHPEHPLVAIVGTRSAGGAAAAVAYAFGKDFGSRGIGVVSGLALGIDSMAHRGNLDAGAATVAVLGCGLDRVYPSSNRTLARRIVETGGVLVSEYAPGIPPYKWNFPARNRIIAGLSRAVLVVEAPESSGALITAQFGLDQGRDVWVASQSLSSPKGAGCKNLAEQGARVASEAANILEDWEYPSPHYS